METEGDAFLSDILLNGDNANVAGLDDPAIPISQEAQTNQDLDVEVVASPSTKGTKRTKNFHYLEDEIVCAGWLKVSKDPINGANQSRTTFWARVHAYFEKNKKTTSVRTESSIMHRWLTIQAQVNKFCSCYEAIKRRNQSGQTIPDKVAEASKLYTELDKQKRKFTLLPCWNILKGEDKWAAKMIELAEQEKLKLAKNKTKKKSTKVGRLRDEEGSNNDQGTNTEDATSNGLETEAKKRPVGVKKAKENLRRGGAEACMEALEKMMAERKEIDKEKEKARHERFMASLVVDKETLELDKETLELEKKRVTIEEKKADAEHKLAEAKLIKEQREIMFADMASLNPVQREWIEKMQKKMLEN